MAGCARYNVRMNEITPQRRWRIFGIRDLLWAMVVVGLAIAAWREHRLNARSQARIDELDSQVVILRAAAEVFRLNSTATASEVIGDLTLSDPGAGSIPIEAFQNLDIQGETVPRRK